MSKTSFSRCDTLEASPGREAGKDQVTEADLAGEPLVWHADTSTQPTRRPHPNAGYLVRGVDETLEHVAAGRGISFLARSATVFY